MQQLKAARVIACVNHDKNAILSHLANHPHALHVTEDIRTLDLSPLIEAAKRELANESNPDMLFIDLFCGAGGVTSGIETAMINAASGRRGLFLWASLECTHFSKARGGLPKNADSRTLAEHLYRYLEIFEFAGIPFEGVLIENVEEFMDWGPLDDDGHAIKERKGEYYNDWVAHMKRYGYKYDWSIRNAADYGDYTSRKRYFGIFHRDSVTLTWPTPTHIKKGGIGFEKWKPVRDVLDLNTVGENIFERERPYAEKTLQRIYEGLKKHRHEEHNLGFLDYYYGHGYSSTLDKPAGTLTTKDRINLVQFLLFPQWGPKCSHSINKPSPVLPARMDKMYTYVVSATIDTPSVEIKNNDSKFTKAIKEFMNESGIAFVYMRSISIPEMLRITGLDNYKLIGTIAEQKKYIGNAVPRRLAQCIVEGFALCRYQSQSKAA